MLYMDPMELELEFLEIDGKTNNLLDLIYKTPEKKIENLGMD